MATRIGNINRKAQSHDNCGAVGHAYLAYDLQAWDDIFCSCPDSSDGRQCPSEYNLRCAIEYDDRHDIENRFLYGVQISGVSFTWLGNELGGA